RAVDVDERRLRPRTESMDEPRDQALAASRLALDQDARRPRRARAREQEPLDVLAYLDHRWALAEQFSTECHPRSPTAVRTSRRAPGSSAGTRGSASPFLTTSKPRGRERGHVRDAPQDRRRPQRSEPPVPNSGKNARTILAREHVGLYWAARPEPGGPHGTLGRTRFSAPPL